MLSDNISRKENGELFFARHSAAALAKKYGTPLYLFDEERIRDNCRMYKDAFFTHFGAGSVPYYAGKAAAFKEMYRIMAEEGMGIDAVSVGEIHTALAAGFPAENILFHGDGKTDADIAYALDKKVGRFAVDNPEELEALNREAVKRGVRQKILLRITPGIDPHTYEEVNTGTVDVKFGVPIETGQAAEFVQSALALPGIKLLGYHCHVGSMVFDEDVYERLADVMTGFMAEMRDRFGFTAEELDLGGGYGVRYTENDPPADIPTRFAEVAARLKADLKKAGLPLPRVSMEPGRSIVADAGMTVYTVSTVKHIPNCKNYAIVDGGMTDNPRYCLYGSRYTVLHGTRESEENDRFDLAGRCCESGDILQRDILLPADTKRGDIVCVCTTGAYNYSMASNYNRLGRPAVVMLTKGGDRIAVRRETSEDLCALDV